MDVDDPYVRNLFQYHVSLQGSVAYVAQQAWIMNATLQDNVLFGDQLKQKEYEKIIDATSLRTDLEIFAAGDQTEIGEKVKYAVVISSF